MKLKLLLVLPLVILSALGVIVLQNQQIVSLSLLVPNSSLGMPLGIVCLVFFLLGIASSLPILLLKADKSKVSHVLEENWQKQDLKLANEIRSDREKQLEAKIETLEIALKSALKKSK